MNDIDRIGFKLHRGLIQMSLSTAGVLYESEHLTSTGHVRWGHYEFLRALQAGEEEESEPGNLRILMENGVWMVPPEERPSLRSEFIYPE